MIGSSSISIVNQDQKDIEQHLIDNLRYFTRNQFLSNECQRWLLPMICSFAYPLCDHDRTRSRSVCRRSCHYFQAKACPNLFTQNSIDMNGKISSIVSQQSMIQWDLF
jgi:hypothetical protein